MFTRTIALATALTTAGALSAYAENTVGADVSLKGKVLENAAEVGTDAETVVDKDSYSDGTQDFVSVGGEVRGSQDEGNTNNAAANEDSMATDTTTQAILNAATEGMMVRTVSGEVIGTVAYKQDQGAAGHLVFVNVDPAANLQVPTVGIQVKSLQTVETGDALEYSFSKDYLRDRIADALNKS